MWKLLLIKEYKRVEESYGRSTDLDVSHARNQPAENSSISIESHDTLPTFTWTPITIFVARLIQDRAVAPRGAWESLKSTSERRLLFSPSFRNPRWWNLLAFGRIRVGVGPSLFDSLSELSGSLQPILYDLPYLLRCWIRMAQWPPATLASCLHTRVGNEERLSSLFARYVYRSTNFDIELFCQSVLFC